MSLAADPTRLSVISLCLLAGGLGSFACTTTEDKGLGSGGSPGTHPGETVVDAATGGGMEEPKLDSAVADVAVAPDAPGPAADGPLDVQGPDGASVDAPPVADAPPDVMTAPVDTRPPTNLPMGAACGKASECKSTFCVDHVCCMSVCNNGCRACAKARTGMNDGLCGPVADLEGKPCGRACGNFFTGVPAVLEKLCAGGECALPVNPKVLDTCYEANNDCIFCDNGSGRCVRDTCAAAGSCCCRAADGGRTCAKQSACTGERMCVQ
jgi:hypothetical protein